MKSENADLIMQKLEDKLPEIVSRKAIRDFTGGIYTTAYLANMDALGTGPSEKFKIGKKVVYTKDSVIEWLKNRITE